MNTKFLTFTIILFALTGCSSQQKPAQDLTLWYDKPATDWYEALPIGNGTLGAMVYGGIVRNTCN